ncbi:hypothetical protein [Haladaptatus sp. DYF46]|nr:hypothetical protein [Haladaptatus sp. DYF46]
MRVELGFPFVAEESVKQRVVVRPPKKHVFAWATLAFEPEALGERP